MLSAKVPLIVGAGLLLVGCALPCAPLADFVGGSLPFQDATPEMLQQQAAEVAASQERLLIFTIISGLLWLAGLAGVAYGIVQWRRQRRQEQQERM